MQRKFKDLSGNKYGRLLVLHRDDSIPHDRKHRPKWICQCDCGNVISVLGSNLARGTSQSCGRLQREQLSQRRKSHGGWANNEPLYEIWHGIIRRCNPSCTGYHAKIYALRGITVCDEWRDYAVFREWTLNTGYQRGLSIDRIDVNGNYEPSNCRWADARTQANNRRDNVFIECNNETHTLKEWSRILDINYQTLYARYKRDLPLDKVFSTQFLNRQRFA